jgi:hypothetical protein
LQVICTVLAILEIEFAPGRDQDGVFGVRQIRHVGQAAARFERPPHAGVSGIRHHAAHAPAIGEQLPITAVAAMPEQRI